MKNKILTFSFLTLLAVSQLSFINSKNTLFTSKGMNNPYIPYSDEATTFSGKSFDIMENMNLIDNGASAQEIIGYTQVFDNSSNDYFNHVKHESSIGETIFGVDLAYEDVPGSNSEHAYYNNSLSNIKRNQTYYWNMSISNKPNHMDSFVTDENLSILDSENFSTHGFIDWETVNNEDKLSKTTINYYSPSNEFPIISPYTETKNDSFKINNVTDDGELTFTMKVSNWTESTEINYLTEEQNIGVTLINEDETDEYLQYEQFNANLVNNNEGYYTYKINGLTPDTNYSFYSINFTGLTVKPSTSLSTYKPDFQITLEGDLQIPSYLTEISTNPYIDPSEAHIFNINKVRDDSIEFSLKIIDLSDKYFNYLETEDNTMDVTMLNIDTQETFTIDAKFIYEKNNIFTFKISELDHHTNYQIISFDNTDINVNGEVDGEILLNEDLNISKEDSTFKTNSKFLFYLVIGIAVLLVLLSIILYIIYFNIKLKRITQFNEAINSDDISK